jgi:RNA polymerase sigma-70 factor (ECF subfamily)
MNTAAAERVLVGSSKAGDHAAFMELIRRNSPMAQRAIRFIACNPADVEDVMQDTVMHAFKGLRSFTGRSTFSTWLTRIAINNALMLRRRRRKQIEISLDAGADGARDGFLQFADSTINPEQSLIREQSIKIVRTAVRALAPRLREIAELRCLKELSNKEVASSLGISLAAAKARSFRASQRLKKSLTSRRSRSV